MATAMGQAIDWLAWRRPISNSAWIQDRISLQKMLQLCSRCLYRMPRRWQQRYHYAAFTLAHGQGTCDGCRHDDVLSMFVSTDDPWYAKCEEQARAATAIKAADRAFTVVDRRRIV